jgi:hypothetical protein
MVNPGWQRLRGRFSVHQLALLAIAAVLGTAAALYQGLSLWQIAVILIALAAWTWPLGAIVLWIARGYARTGQASG